MSIRERIQLLDPGTREIARPAPDHRRTRATLILAACFTIYWLIVLRVDSGASLNQQMALGLTTWAFLAVALHGSPARERIQVLTMIGVATLCECIGSLLWGAYSYRLDNLPLYVPAGHGIFFLVAVRLSELPWLDPHRRLLIGGTLVGSGLLVVRGLALLPEPDVLGLATWLVLVRFLLFGRRPALYAISYAMTMALEFYGTAHGSWAWAPVLPAVGIGVGNPPAGIGAAYCAMDGLARRIAPRVERLFSDARRHGYVSGDDQLLLESSPSVLHHSQSR